MAASRLRATVHGTWWTSQMSKIRFCFVCGGKLEKRYVPADKKRRLVCTKCLHITYVNPKSVGALIPVMPDGRVVLLKRSTEPGRGKWTYPAGYQEIGESVDQAALREAWEETGVDAVITHLVGVYSYADGIVVTTVYEGRVEKGCKPIPKEEAEDVKFFKPNEIPWKDLAFRSTVHALEKWVKSR